MNDRQNEEEDEYPFLYSEDQSGEPTITAPDEQEIAPFDDEQEDSA